MFTEYGLQMIEKAKKSGMCDHYDAYMGNFGFTDLEVVEHNIDILKWLKDNEDYALIFQEGYENGIRWWLTTEF